MRANPIINHSAAHLLAMAVLKLFPGTKLAIGPAIDEGFYYDFLFVEPISDTQLAKISKQMEKFAAAALPFEKSELTREQARKLFADQPFKLELIDDIDGPISVYANGKQFVDLCVGPHVPKTSDIKHFALTHLAGSYWRGDAKRPMLTRIYGTAWQTEKELQDYLQLVEERKQRDHRKLGKDLDLFTFELMAGQGMPIWLPNGMVVRNEISRFLDEQEQRYGFQAVGTPVMGNVNLYIASGHWAHYKKNMFPVMDVDGELLVLRPMTCPHHCLVYKHALRSYRDLPFRTCENALLHRYEPSGSLTGLERVRSMVLTDGHSFCAFEQIQSEVEHVYRMIEEVHKALGITIDYVALSLRDKNDKEKYYENEAMWKEAEGALRSACSRLGINVVEIEGEAAFYGPKLDFQARSALGHEITISTIQLDMLLPERFELEYKAADGTMKRPILIHRGLIGTYERFVATLLEQTKGVLPLWLAPVQVQIIPVVPERHAAFALELAERFQAMGLRVKCDMREDRVGKKIRDAQIKKIPYQIVIGDTELAAKTSVTYRKYGEQEVQTVSEQDFVTALTSQRTARC